VKAKLHILFLVLDKYDCPASRSGRLILAIVWKGVWIGAKLNGRAKSLAGKGYRSLACQTHA